MAFEDIRVQVWRRDGPLIAQHDVSPNGEFPAEGDWTIPPGRDVCLTVLVLGEKTSFEASRKSFCLPEFDKRSVRLRVEVDSATSLLSVSPMLRKGKPLPGNVDAYSLRLNALPETVGPLM